MGSDDTEHPQYQMGQGCLIDQLVGRQYLAEVGGLGALVSRDHIHSTLASLYHFNYKRSMIGHNNVERTFALNDEAALVICDYGASPRPQIPFPYYAEVMTGFEHSAAALMIFSGMVGEGVECIGNIRSRYDGVKRNPWETWKTILLSVIGTTRRCGSCTSTANIATSSPSAKITSRSVRKPAGLGIP